MGYIVLYSKLERKYRAHQILHVRTREVIKRKSGSTEHVPYSLFLGAYYRLAQLYYRTDYTHILECL